MKTQYNTLAHCLAAAALLGAGLAASPAHALVVNLTAEAYNATMPNGDVVTMWGYRQDAGAVQSPGAQLIVPPGDTTLTINVTNNLTLPTSIIVHGLNQAPLVAGGRVDPVYTDMLLPDTRTTPVTCAVGSSRFCRIRSLTHEAAPGGTASYTYNNVKPGTYMYQSGTLPQIQVQMGLYGMVSKNAVDPVVTPPSAGQAYPGLTVDNEIKLVFSEVDPLLHQSVVAGTFTGSTLDYAPKHMRVHSYDATGATASLVTAANQTVVIAGGSRQLIRMVNAGLLTRVPMISDGTWFAVAEDGNAYPYPREQYTAFLPAAKTMDVYYTPTPAGAGGVGAPARNVALFDRRMAMDADTATTNGVRGQFVNLSVSNVAGPALTAPTVSVASCSTIGTQDLAYSCAAAGNAAGYAYSLVAAPAGMAINATTGAISWTPTNAQAARSAAPSTVNPVTVRATVLTGTLAGQSADASLSVVVGNVNDAPVGATAKAYTVAGGALAVPVATGVSLGVTDIDGDALAASVVTAPANGTVTMNADGSFTYKATTLPLTGTSAVSFTYKVADVPLSPLNPGPALSTAPATVTLTLLPNVRPVAGNDVFTNTLSTAIPRPTIALNVLTNDTDSDGTIDVTSVRLVASPGVIVAPGGLGAVTLRGGSVITVNATTGAISYTPGLLVVRNTAENFMYTVKDNFGGVSNSASIRITTQ